MLPYTGSQAIRNSKLPTVPPRIWLNFLATTGRRARFITAFENHGEIPAERTDTLRFFHLRTSPVMAAPADRLVIEWPRDAVNWAKAGTLAAAFPVVEVADPSTPALGSGSFRHGESMPSGWPGPLRRAVRPAQLSRRPVPGRV